MLRRSLKYILIAIGNVVFLFLLLNVATYDLRLLLGISGIVNGWVPLPMIFVGSLIGMTILTVVIKRKSRELNWKSKMVYATLLTLLLSGYYYFDYGIATFNRYYDSSRKELTNKIEPLFMLAHGSQAEGLTYSEYQVLLRWKNFPEVSNLSENISYKYAYDGFLSDYIFQLSYEVPIQEEIETIDLRGNQFSQYQSFEIVGNRKIVSYSEGKT